MPRYQSNNSTRVSCAQPPPYRESTQGQPYSQTERPEYPDRRFLLQTSHGESTNLLGSQSYGAIDLRRQKPEGVFFSLRTFCLIVGFLMTFSLVMGYFLSEPINEAQHTSTRRQWNMEVRKHEELRSRMYDEKEAFMEEKRGWELERSQRAEEESRRQEEEKRQREMISWSNLGPGHCLSYGTREYTATLINVPLGFNPIDECWKKSIEIHGKQWRPTSCENEGVCGRVTGHWKVNSNEGGCSPWWSYFKDKGCVQRGIRRHEAPLENFSSNDNWQEICSTTPANIGGVHYDGPTSCVDWGKYGKWGIWLVSDSNCW